MSLSLSISMTGRGLRTVSQSVWEFLLHCTHSGNSSRELLFSLTSSSIKLTNADESILFSKLRLEPLGFVEAAKSHLLAFAPRPLLMSLRDCVLRNSAFKSVPLCYPVTANHMQSVGGTKTW